MRHLPNMSAWTLWCDCWFRNDKNCQNCIRLYISFGFILFYVSWELQFHTTFVPSIILSLLFIRCHPERMSHVCDMKFKESGHLNIHRGTHTDEKLIVCPDFDKESSDRSHMIINCRNFTGEKPFVCPACEKKFKHSRSLNIHRRIHTGEKPFACSDCDKKFKESGHLKSHCKSTLVKSRSPALFVTRNS